MSPVLALLLVSNSFMTYSWFVYLNEPSGDGLLLFIILAWGIAFLSFFYDRPIRQVP
ncbi:MAG: DMT family protein [Bdellovibrionota bacterium]